MTTGFSKNRYMAPTSMEQTKASINDNIIDAANGNTQDAASPRHRTTNEPAPDTIKLLVLTKGKKRPSNGLDRDA